VIFSDGLGVTEAAVLSSGEPATREMPHVFVSLAIPARPIDLGTLIPGQFPDGVDGRPPLGLLSCADPDPVMQHPGTIAIVVSAAR